MSITVKIGWLKDSNGDKFAPKTLASQVQMSDGTLLEEYINDKIEKVTPIKGVDYHDGNDYVLTDSDKDEIADLVISAMGGQPIFGYVDYNNNLIINAALADGVYSVKYELAKGNTVDVGDFTVGVLLLSTNFTNCYFEGSTHTEQTGINIGDTFSASIAPNDGYSISSVTVMMGDVDVTSAVLNGYDIYIGNVTGNVTITAVAEKAVVKTNFFKATPTVNTIATASEDAMVIGGRLGSDSGYRVDGGPDCLLSNYIEVMSGDVVEVTNLAFQTSLNSAMYTSDKTIIGAFLPTNTAYISDVVTSGNKTTFKIVHANAGFVRICGKPDSSIKVGSDTTVNTRYDCSQIVVNVKRNGTYL